jgi:hypothetical protein
MLRNTAIIAARMGRASILVSLEASAVWQAQPLAQRREYLDVAFEQAASNGRTTSTWAAINLYMQTCKDFRTGLEPVELLREFIERCLVRVKATNPLMQSLFWCDQK